MGARRLLTFAVGGSNDLIKRGWIRCGGNGGRFPLGCDPIFERGVPGEGGVEASLPVPPKVSTLGVGAPARQACEVKSMV